MEGAGEVGEPDDEAPYWWSDEMKAWKTYVAANEVSDDDQVLLLYEARDRGLSVVDYLELRVVGEDGFRHLPNHCLRCDEVGYPTKLGNSRDWVPLFEHPSDEAAPPSHWVHHKCLIDHRRRSGMKALLSGAEHIAAEADPTNGETVVSLSDARKRKVISDIGAAAGRLGNAMQQLDEVVGEMKRRGIDVDALMKELSDS